MLQTSLNSHLNNSSDKEASYGQMLSVFIRRFPWFLLVFLSSTAVAGIITAKTQPTFQSTLQLLIEPNYQGREKEDKLGTDFTESNIVIDTATQLNLMTSSALLEKAVIRLKSEYPDMNTKRLKESLLVTQIKTPEDNIATKIFQIDYTSEDPYKTQKVLTAIQEIYLEYNKNQQDIRLQKGLQIIREQLNKASDEVNASEANLQRFRRNQNLIDPELEAKAIEETLNSIRKERQLTHSLYQEAIAKQKSLQQQLNRSPQNALVSSRLSQSTRYQGLLNEIQKTELALAQERLRFTDDTPNVQKLNQQLQDQKGLLEKEVTRTLGENNNSLNLGENLLEQGQLGEIDLNLTSELVATQTNIVALSARDQTLSQKESQLQLQLKRFPSLLAYYNRIIPQLKFSRERMEQLLRAEQQLRQELSKGGFNWQVVEEPKMGIKLGPNLSQNLLLGAIVGFILGGVAAFIRDSSDDAVHTTAQLQKQLALPLLGTTPKLPSAKGKESVIKLPFGKPDVLAPWTIQVLQSSPGWESLDLIYKNIELLHSKSDLKSLMVTSALPDTSKSSLTLGLAMSAARLHKRVLLIDANLRDPSLHKQLNLPNEQGLSTLLANDANIPHQIGISCSGSAYIDILTAGPIPADPAHLLSSPRMREIITIFEENYDLVLIDAPSVLGIVDAIITGSSCRSVVMVASIGKVTHNHLAQATSMLSKLNLIGVVANGVSDSESTYVPYIKPQPLALKEFVEK